MFFLLFLAELM
jgi:IAA-amino acid hydrolase